MSSGEMIIVPPDRVADIDLKHERIAQFLSTEGLDGLILQKSCNFSWFTSGGKNGTSEGDHSQAALFLTPTARLVICQNSDTTQIFDHELPGAGFQLKERPWMEPLESLLLDLCRGRQVGSDCGLSKTRDVSNVIAKLRSPFSNFECAKLRELGSDLSHAVEATGRNLTVGRTEAEIAGELVHRLSKREIEGVRIQILADNRRNRHPNWTFDRSPVNHCCTLLAIGRRHGLLLGTSRTVALTPMEPHAKSDFQHATMLSATAARFAQAGWTLGETMERVKRIYEKLDQVDEWREAPIGGTIGYEVCEARLQPRSAYQLSAPSCCLFHPKVRQSINAVSILVEQSGFDVLTSVENWPVMEVTVKDQIVSMPGILQLG